MDRAIRLFAGTVLVALVACSNDAEMPAQYHRDLLAQPTNVQAGIEEGVVSVSWQMATAENVAGFVVSFTDASGGMETKSVPRSRSPRLCRRWIVEYRIGDRLADSRVWAGRRPRFFLGRNPRPLS